MLFFSHAVPTAIETRGTTSHGRTLRPAESRVTLPASHSGTAHAEHSIFTSLCQRPRRLSDSEVSTDMAQLGRCPLIADAPFLEVPATVALASLQQRLDGTKV